MQLSLSCGIATARLVRIRSASALLASAWIGVAAAQAGQSSIAIRTVALSGQQAPGLPDGVSFFDPLFETAFPSRPIIDNTDGNVIAHIFLTGPGISIAPGIGNARTLWKETTVNGSRTLDLLARQGDPAPGTSGVFEAFPSPFSAPTLGMADGHTSFRGFLRFALPFSFGVWSNTSGPVELQLMVGEQAPGLPPGLTFGRPGDPNPFVAPSVNASGRLLQGVFLDGTGVTADNDESLWSDRSGRLQLVLREGDPAPGTRAVFGASPDSFSPGGLRAFVFNNKSHIALHGNLRGDGISFLNDDGVWVEDEQGLQLIALEGQPAPGTPWTFGEGGVGDTFNRIVFNNDGKLAFRAGLSPGSIHSSNASLWSNRSGELSMIVGPGIDQPGVPVGSVAGAHFYNLTATGSAIGFIASIDSFDPNQIFIEDAGIWHDLSGGMQLVVKSGDQVPGEVDGVVFGSMAEFDGRDLFRLGTHGDIGFRAELKGPGIIDGFNSTSYFLVSPDGKVHEVIRDREPFDLNGDGTDVRIVKDILPGNMNDTGEFTFKAVFDDDTLGIFTARIDVPPFPWSSRVRPERTGGGESS